MKLLKSLFLCFILIPCLAVENYWRPLTITEMSGNTLEDYQISFVLDTKNLIEKNKMREDCGDLRIYGNGAWLFRFTPLKTGSESIMSFPLTSDEQTAFSVYLNSLEIPYWKNSEKIYIKMKTTNGVSEEISAIVNESSHSAPEEVFRHFDDNGRLNLYENISGEWINASGRLTSLTASKMSVLLTNGTVEDFYAEGAFEVEDALGTIGFVFRYQDVLNFYGSQINPYLDKLSLLKMKNGELIQFDLTLPNLSENTTYHHNLTVSNNSLEACIWAHLENISCVTATDDSFSSGRFGIQTDYIGAYADNIFMYDLMPVQNVWKSEFVFSSSGTELPLWIEGGCNTNETVVWFKAPYLRKGENTTFFVNYGGKTSGEKETFNFSDDSAVEKYPGNEFYFDYTCNITSRLFFLDSGGEYPIAWKCILNLTNENNFLEKLFFTSIFNENEIHFTDLPLSRPLTEEASNESLSAMTNNSAFSLNGVTYSCISYLSSKSLNATYFLKPIPYDPKISHIFSATAAGVSESHGTLTNGSWWAKYEGNGTEVFACLAGGKEPGFLWCGDGACTEGCSSCPEDCGICRTFGSGSSPPVQEENATASETVNETPFEEVNDSTYYSDNSLYAFFSEYSGNLSSDGITVAVFSPSRVSIIEGLVLTDGKKIFAGKLILPEGNYTLAENAKTPVRLGWTILGIAGLELVLTALLLARHSKPF